MDVDGQQEDAVEDTLANRELTQRQRRESKEVGVGGKGGD